MDKTAEIPIDWDGAMGVPITFLDKYNPEQFEVLGITDRDNNSGLKTKGIHLEKMCLTIGDLNSREGVVIRIGRRIYEPTYSSPSDKEKVRPQ